jgi:hypothetical protein
MPESLGLFGQSRSHGQFQNTLFIPSFNKIELFAERIATVFEDCEGTAEFGEAYLAIHD